MGNGWSMRHALRPDGVPDRTGWRPTVCGARARRVTPAFDPATEAPRGGMPVCLTCTRIARRYPLERAIDPSNDLAVMTALVGRLRAQHHWPEATLRPALTDLLDRIGLPGGALRATDRR
jgi:hypothetical protein